MLNHVQIGKLLSSYQTDDGERRVPPDLIGTISWSFACVRLLFDLWFALFFVEAVQQTYVENVELLVDTNSHANFALPPVQIITRVERAAPASVKLTFMQLQSL